MKLDDVALRAAAKAASPLAAYSGQTQLATAAITAYFKALEADGLSFSMDNFVLMDELAPRFKGSVTIIRGRVTKDV